MGRKRGFVLMDRHGLVCRTVLEQPDITQREMAQKLKVSLGTANGLIKECIGMGYIAERGDGAAGSGWELTGEGKRLLKGYKVDGALIIAAGFGSRFVPLTFETPKGLLEVFGERMIERQIGQLHEAGVTDITIAVGYLKEKFEYLIDKYDVKLLYNPEYPDKNTLATIHRSRKVLEGRNMYVLSSDNWMRENMFHAYECGAWYSAAYQHGETKEWCLSFNKRGRITDVTSGSCMDRPIFPGSFPHGSFLCWRPITKARARSSFTGNRYMWTCCQARPGAVWNRKAGLCLMRPQRPAACRPPIGMRLKWMQTASPTTRYMSSRTWKNCAYSTPGIRIILTTRP